MNYRALWQETHGPIPEGHVIHHVNGDHNDDRIENLQALTLSEHRRAHPGAKPQGLGLSNQGRILREYRKTLKVGQDELALELGRANASHVCRMERKGLTSAELTDATAAIQRILARRAEDQTPIQDVLGALLP